MVRGEISVTCPSCEMRMVFPIAALRRNNAHCSTCGSPIPLTNVQVPVFDDRKKRKPRKSPYRRRR